MTQSRDSKPCVILTKGGSSAVSLLIGAQLSSPRPLSLHHAAAIYYLAMSVKRGGELGYTGHKADETTRIMDSGMKLELVPSSGEWK